MAVQALPLQMTYNRGATVYAVIHAVVAGTPSVWNPTLNTGAGGWEAFNASHWSQDAIPLTEQTGSGFYSATFPAGISGVVPSEVYYAQNGGSPAISDTIISSPGQSQGASVRAVAGDPVAAGNMQASGGSAEVGACAGTPTTTSIPTNLQDTQANVYVGRRLILTSGAAIRCAATIIAYAPTNGVLTLAAPLPVAPTAADTFVIV